MSDSNQYWLTYIIWIILNETKNRFLLAEIDFFELKD